MEVLDRHNSTLSSIVGKDADYVLVTTGYSNYQSQLLPTPLSLQAIFEKAHEYGLEAESETIGDLNGWWQAPRMQQQGSGSLISPPLVIRFIYSTVEYDVVHKTGASGNK